MARTYVPGYGYVDSNDPGTRGSVKPGRKPFSSGQEPTRPAPQPPRSQQPDDWFEKWKASQPGMSNDQPGATQATAGVSSESDPTGMRVEDPTLSLDPLQGVNFADDATFDTEELAQTVADQRNGYVIEENGQYRVVYGQEAVQAELADAAERRKYENLTATRERMPGDNDPAPGADLTYYGSTSTGDTPITRARRDAREYAFYTNTAQVPKDAGLMTVDTYFDLKQKQDGKAFGVYMGTVTTAGSTGATAVDIVKDSRIVEDYTMLSDQEQAEVVRLVDRYYKGMPWTFAWIDKRWKDAVDRANKRLLLYGEKVTPFEVFDRMIAAERARDDERRSTSGSRGWYGSGGGYGGGGTSATIRLTSVTDARVILNQAMTQYLGREATAQEIDKFVKALNAQESASPITQMFDGDTAIQSGGFNPSTFAEDYARSMSGSSEYRAVTSLLDALIGELDGNTGVL